VAPLSATAAGRLVFREPPEPKGAQSQAPEPARQQPAVRVLNGIRTLLGAKTTPAVRPAAPSESVLHLRSGDLVTCRVERVDEEGVWLKSAQASADFIPHAKIKALELRADAPSVKIEKAKFERLLMLPRMQRTSPPQQLIRSLDGDYLRGRLLAMDEKQLVVEVQLEPRTIERAQVARIIWLHPDEMAPKAEDVAVSPSAVEPAAESTGIRVQAVPPDNRRLTFTAQKLDGALLSGVSDVLGECHVDLTKIDQLLIGRAIDHDAASLVFHQWRLKPAPDPLPDPNEGGEPGEHEGLESVLVGKPAPPIELEMLDGNKLRLDDYKNQVLVLDFWASWCGPCLQTMPLVDRVVDELAGEGVKLVGINLQETPEKVRSALERLKLEMPVALDKDGRTAERYGATAIPQTVIIDRTGKVARVFVGGNSRFDEQLRQALKAVLSGRAEGSQSESDSEKPTVERPTRSEP
jgi:thiol-disulfide isomerase/thioredoxin